MAPRFETESRTINNIRGNLNGTEKEKNEAVFVIFVSKALHFNEFSICFI